MHVFEVGTLRDADLTSLVEVRAAESRTLEFKSQLPGKNDAERKEFLADVTSFANAQGGVVLYGLGTTRDERGRDTGIAETLPGLPELVADQEIQRLESMLRDGVDPGLTAQFQVISRSDGSPPLLALGVFRSYAGPHQVTFAGSRRFWVRGQAGKYEPDVSELRRLFLSRASWLGQADEVRTARLNILRSTPSMLHGSVTLVHVLPLAPSETLLDLVTHEAKLRTFPPLQHVSGWSHRFNVDGFMTYEQDYEDRRMLSYTQWLRSGGVEGFASTLIGERDFGNKSFKVVWLQPIKTAVLDWVAKATAVLGDPLKVEPPYVVLLTLQGVLGARIPDGRGTLTTHSIDVEDLKLPPILLEPGKSDFRGILQPLFDIIAQSAGLATAPAP